MSFKRCCNTQLCAASFFNVSPDNGSVCLGNAKLVKPEILSFENFVKYWENMFFLSEFSQITGGNPTKHNLVLIVKNSTKVFDNEELIPVKKLRLKELLK